MRKGLILILVCAAVTLGITAGLNSDWRKARVAKAMAEQTRQFDERDATHRAHFSPRAVSRDDKGCVIYETGSGRYRRFFSSCEENPTNQTAKEPATRTTDSRRMEQ